MMYLGVLYNTFVCLISGFTGLSVFFTLRKMRKNRKVEYSESLDYFLLLLGVLWSLVGARLFLVWLGVIDLELFVYKWLVGPLTYIHLMPAFYYFGWSFFQNKKKIYFLFVGFFTVMALSSVFFLFKNGFTRPELTYWGNNIVPNKISNQLFTFGIFIPAVPCIVIELFRRSSRWRKSKSLIEKQLLGFNFGLLIYAMTGFFEALVFAQGWQMLLVRIGIMLSPLIFYLSATLET